MKNKKGFTLIELLAVIVILAIIALIATPVIMNIINSSRKNSAVDSAKLIVKEAQLAYHSASTQTGGFNPTIEEIEEHFKADGVTIENHMAKDGFGNICTFTTTNKFIVTCENEKYESVSDIKSTGEMLLAGSATPICEKVTSSTNGNVPAGQYKPGDEYKCQVNDTTTQNFYILSNNSDGTINLITTESLSVDSWITQSDYNDNANWNSMGNTDKGPITAMNSNNNLTKNWTKVPNIKMNYKDENIDPSTLEEGTHSTGYDGIYTTDDTTIIKSSLGTTVATYTNLKSRLITMKEILDLGCTQQINTCPTWLNKFGSKGAFCWSLSSNASYSYIAFDIYGSGWPYYGTSSSTTEAGIRPVITLPKSMLN